MKKYTYIGIGGFLGAISRLFIKNINFPGILGMSYNILIINVLGSFILSLFLFLTLLKWKLDENIKLGISGGFIGAFTTFSTFCKESVYYINNNKIYYFMAYTLSSILLGLFAAYVGYLSATLIINKASKSPLEDEEKAI